MSEVITVFKRRGGFESRTSELMQFGIDNQSDEITDDESIGDDDDIMMNGVNPKGTRSASQVVTPGELVTDDSVWMRGHGTYYLENETYSSVAGVVSRVNKLLSVIPLKSRYSPETGDHVVGRIAEVGNRRWKVDIGSRQHAVLMLGSVNLPGGILRRKSETDELQMRNFLKEGDLLNAEVQSLFQDGSAALHTRSLKYGKLRNGFFIQVPSSLIIRSKNHTHNLPGNVTVVLGVNGYIWLRKSTQMDNAKDSVTTEISNGSTDHKHGKTGPTGSVSLNPSSNVAITRLEEESSWQIYSDENDPDITERIRQTISRYANVIKALAYCELGITQERIISAYEASMAYPTVGSLIERETMDSIGQDVLQMEKMRGNAS